MEAAIWGFLGTVVGATASIAASWIATQSETKRQLQADSFERVERARAFQRDTLLDLQQTIQDAMRYMGKMWAADQRATVEAGEWTRCFPLPDDVNDGAHATGVRLVLLTERIADDGLREDLTRLRAAIDGYVLASSHEHANSVVRRAMETYEPVMQRVGTLLRSLY